MCPPKKRFSWKASTQIVNDMIAYFSQFFYPLSKKRRPQRALFWRRLGYLSPIEKVEG